jgi:hypothetical protein
MKDKVFYGLDLLKFFMATMIVAIHTNAWEYPLFHTLFWPFVRSAVPVFFVLSAFFYFRRQRVLGYSLGFHFHFVKRICGLYFFWFIINLPFILYQSHYDLISDTLGGNILIMIKYMLFYQLFGYPGSWFFSGLVLGVTIISFMKRCKVPDIFVCLLSLYCYFFTWWPEFMSGFSRIIHQWWSVNISPRVSLSFWVAVLWCFLGYLMSSKGFEAAINWIQKSLGLCVIGIFLLFIYLSYVVMDGTIKDYAWMNLIWVPTIVIFFYLLNLSHWHGYKLMRELSIEIYMLHFIVLRFIRRIILNDVMMNYFTVLSICIILGLIIIWLERNRWFKWISYSH